MADPVVTSHHAIAPAVERRRHRDHHHRRRDRHRRGRRVPHRRGRAGRDVHPAVLLPPAAEAGGHVPDVPGRGVAGPAGATLQPACYVAVADGMEVVTDLGEGQEGPGRRARDAAREPPARLPRVRQGRRVPAAGPGARLRAGGEPVPGGEAALGQAHPISELVLLDRERCIQCGRCVRFANEIAGEAQIDFLGRGDAVEVNVFEGHAFSSYFSGNTVQICPVGALTAVALPLHGPALGPRPGRVDLHAVRLRLPGRRAVVGQPDHPPARHGQRSGQPVLAVRQGPLRGARRPTPTPG